MDFSIVMETKAGMFHWHQIWKHMRDLTDCDIEKRAIMEIITFFEPKINAVIIESEKERRRINQRRKIQGLSEKKRIDQICIKNAIKNINKDTVSSSPTRGGERKQNNHVEKKKHLKHEITEVT